MAQVDYDALAEQARKAAPPVDYDALAEQARKGSAPPAHPPAPVVPTWADKAGLHEPTASPVRGFLRGAGTAAVDMAEGVKAGAARTIFGGGDLIRRATGMDRVIKTPAVQAAMTAPDSFAGKTGLYGEQAAEFAVPLSKVSKAVKGAGFLARTAAEGAASGAVSAVQSGGDLKTTAGGALVGAAGPALAAGAKGLIGVGQRAAAGAAEDGVGGAIAGVIRSAAPVEPKAMLVQALKPRAANVGFTKSLELAIPELKATEAETGTPIKGVDDLLKAVKTAKQRVRAQYDAIAGPRRAMGSTVDLSPVADAMQQSIPDTTHLETPEKAAGILATADKYRARVPLEKAEQYLQETNAQLESFYNKYPMAQRKALAADPDVAPVVAKAKALRDAIYATLDGVDQPPAARELNRRYGALMDVEQEAYRRANVAARQQPESLSQQIGKVRAAGQMAKGGWRLLHGDLSGAADIAGARAGSAMSDYLKEQQTSDALVRRALAGSKQLPTPVVAPTMRPVRGLLGPGARPMPSAPDTSFVRSVPAMAQPPNPRRLLSAPAPEPTAPPTPPRRVFHMGGDVQPDASKVGSVPAAPIAYHVDPTVKVKAGGVRVAQFSGDPEAARAALADPKTKDMLRRMRADLDTFEPVRGRLIRSEGSAVKDTYSHGAAGSPIAEDIRVISEQHVDNGQLKRAIDDMLADKTPTTRLHTAVLDAATGYLEKRPGYIGPSVPQEIADHPAGTAAPAHEDDGYEAFSKAIDDIVGQPEASSADVAAAPEPAKPPNRFRERLAVAEAEYNRLTGRSAHDTQMAESFPLGGGFRRAGADKAIDRSVTNAKRVTELHSEIQRLRAHADAFDAGTVNRQGRSISPKKGRP